MIVDVKRIAQLIIDKINKQPERETNMVIELDELIRTWSAEEKAEFFESVAKEQKLIIDELKELTLDLFCQATGGHPDGQYDHMCLSAYEKAQDKLLEWGLIKEEQCSRR